MKKLMVVLVLLFVLNICSGCGVITALSYNREETLKKIASATTVEELEILNELGSNLRGVGMSRWTLSNVDGDASKKLYKKINTIERKNKKIKEKMEDKKIKEKMSAEHQKRIDYVNKTYPENSVMANYIINKQIMLGMTTQDVIMCIGYTAQINRTVGSWGIHEQWVYYGSIYLYFENGILTSWQD